MQDTVDSALEAPGQGSGQGRQERSGLVVVCEGLATGASLHKATGQPVVVPLNALPRLTGFNHRADEGGLWVCAGRLRLAQGEINAYANGQRPQPASAPDERPTPMRAEVALNMESGSWIVGHHLTPDQARELAYALMRAAQAVDGWTSEVRS